MFKIQKIKKTKKSKIGKIKLFQAKLKAFFEMYKLRSHQYVLFLNRYKIQVAIFLFISIVGSSLISSRNNFISQVKRPSALDVSSQILSPSPIPEATQLLSDRPYGPDLDVLGIATEKETQYIPPPIYIPKPLPTPIYTPVPLPTRTPTPVVITYPSTNTSSSSSSGGKNCSNLGTSPGVATAWYSQASTPQTVEHTATITLELRDCNNNFAPVSDTLTISQSSGPSTTVNGSKPPISIEASNGRASFTVKSQTSGTAVYMVRNTTKSFYVTDPNNKHPQVTFNIAATPTAAPTASPSPSPAATSSPLPSETPATTSSPTPVSSSTPTPDPSPSTI